jgi:TRAP-type C4-dicarboxylate transport system permease large subunit
MVITLPFVLPVVKALGGDLIWFGVVAVVAIEIGLLTPPFGISCFVIKATVDDPTISLRDIFMGALPFGAVMFVVLWILIVFPKISLALV